MSHPRTQCNVPDQGSNPDVLSRDECTNQEATTPLQEGMAFIYLQVSKVFCYVQVSARMVLTYLQDLKQGKRNEQLLRKLEHPEQTLVCHHLELVRHLLDGANQ